MKICTACREEKDESDFYFRSREKGTLQPLCIPCQNDKVNKHYADNKEYYKDKSRKRIEKVRGRTREKLIEYFTAHPCVDCGETDLVVLEFDHLHDKKFNVTSRKSYTWEQVLPEIEKCEVRCCNCHRRKTAERANTWRWQARQVPLV